MKNCRYCGREIDDYVLECPHCGWVQETVQREDVNSSNRNTERKYSKNVLIKTIIAFVAASIVLLVILSVAGGNESGKIESTMYDYFEAWNDKDVEDFIEIHVPKSVLNKLGVDDYSYSSAQDEVFPKDSMVYYEKIKIKDTYPVDSDEVEKRLRTLWTYTISVEKACAMDVSCYEGTDGDYEKVEKTVVLYKHEGKWYVYDMADKS